MKEKKSKASSEIKPVDKKNGYPPLPEGKTEKDGKWVPGKGADSDKYVWQPSNAQSSTKDASKTNNLSDKYISDQKYDQITAEQKAKADKNKVETGAVHEGFNTTQVPGSSGAPSVTETVKEYDSTGGSKVQFAGFNAGEQVGAGSAKAQGDIYAAQITRQNSLADAGALSGFIVPWDKWGRFSIAYTNSQSIGNNMPFGAEWVGSPALINSHALIRFDHIAGRKHHTKILNQINDQSFRTTRTRYVYSSATKEDREEAKKAGLSENTKTISKGALRKNFNIDIAGGENETVEVKTDESGLYYVEVPDETKKTWRKTDGKGAQRLNWVEVTYTYDENNNQVKHEIPQKYEIAEDEMPTIDVDVNSSESDVEVASSDTKKSEKDDNSKNSKGQNLDNKAVHKNKPGWSKNPNTPEFWLYVKFGWQKCGDQVIPPDANCEKGKAVIPKGDTDEKSKQIQDSIVAKAVADLKKAEKWAARGWKASNGTKRLYLTKPGMTTDAKEAMEPTTINLCDPANWRGQEQWTYNWTDFLYCTYYGWIPNNYLITLRRFPMPVGDNGMIPDQDTNNKYMLPVAKAVTWIGEATGNKIEELATFTTKLNWREIKAEVNEIQGNEQGALDGSPFGGVAKFLGMINAVTSGGNFGAISGWDEQRAKFDPYKDGSYYNKIYGPVNVVDKVKARDRGLEFEHSISINFHYSTKEIGGINEKAAMLDIIANLLALTTNNADFWGGANRYFPNKPAYPFLGDKKGMEKWYSGDVTGFMSAVGNQLADTFKGVFDTLQDFLTNPGEALKKLATSGAKLAAAEQIRKKGRPAMLGFKALLQGAPVGEWHLMIGNPFNPFMMIGNLICTGITFTFGNTFGIDDFPEELVAKITLEHGKPRDKGDIESMFNRGGGRLHYAYFGEQEAWNTTSATRDTKINQWEFKKNSSRQTGTKGTSNVIDTAMKEGHSLYKRTAKEAIKLAHKVSFS